MYDSQNGDMGKDEEEKTLEGKRLFSKYNNIPNFTQYTTIYTKAINSCNTYLPPINTTPNLLAGLPQAMDVAVSVNASANFRYDSFSPTVSLSYK